MSALGLRPSGQWGVSPRHRRSSSLSFLPDQLADWSFRADAPLNAVTGGAIRQAFELSGDGRHGTATDRTAGPLATMHPSDQPCMRFDGVSDSLEVRSPPSLAAGAGPFNYADVDVMGTVGIAAGLAARVQLKLIDGASIKSGYEE